MEWNDDSYYQLFRSGAFMAVTFDFLGAIIASTYKEEVKFTLPAVQLRGGSPTITGPDVLGASVPFKAFDNGAAAPLTIDYVSTDVTVP